MGFFSRKKDSSRSGLQVPSFQQLMETPPEPPPVLNTNPPSAGLPPEPPNLTSRMAPPSLEPTPMRIPLPPTANQLPPSASAELQGENFTEQEAGEFELPDFEDSELQSLRELEVHLEPIVHEVKQEEHEQTNTWDSEAGQASLMVPPPRSPMEKIEMVPSPEPLKQEQVPVPEYKYVELVDFFKIKESLMTAKTVTRDMEEEMLAETYKTKLAKIINFSSSLNAIQDRLMLIDGKLFEKPEVSD